MPVILWVLNLFELQSFWLGQGFAGKAEQRRKLIVEETSQRKQSVEQKDFQAVKQKISQAVEQKIF